MRTARHQVSLMPGRVSRPLTHATKPQRGECIRRLGWRPAVEHVRIPVFSPTRPAGRRLTIDVCCTAMVRDCGDAYRVRAGTSVPRCASGEAAVAGSGSGDAGETLAVNRVCGLRRATHCAPRRLCTASHPSLYAATRTSSIASMPNDSHSPGCWSMTWSTAPQSESDRPRQPTGRGCDTTSISCPSSGHHMQRRMFRRATFSPPPRTTSLGWVRHC